MEKDKNYSRLLDEQIGLVARENRYLEFKSNYQDTDKLGRYISALSNGACLERQDFAYLYFGVKDETWDVIGTTFDVSKEKAKGNQSLEIYLRQYVSPSIDFADAEFIYANQFRVVRFKIPAVAGSPTCYMWKPYSTRCRNRRNSTRSNLLYGEAVCKGG